jgi:hypothetical protein
MKIELTPDNAAALTKYAELAGQTPAEFLNRYLTDNMVALFENPPIRRTGKPPGQPRISRRADAERVVAWMEKRVRERPDRRTAFEAEIVEDIENGCFWIEATTTTIGVTCPV